MGNDRFTQTVDNTVHSLGTGKWKIITYKPQGSCGIFEGSLSVTRDFHRITRNVKTADGSINQRVVGSFPNQNVAAAFIEEAVTNLNHNYENCWPEYVVSSE